MSMSLLCTIPIEPEVGTTLIYLFNVRSLETHRTFRFWFTAYPSKKVLLAALGRRTSAMATRLGEPDCPDDQTEALDDVQVVEDRVRAKWPKTPPTTYGYRFPLPREAAVEATLTAV